MNLKTLDQFKAKDFLAATFTLLSASFTPLSAAAFH
jgi:hypothetical protein